MARGTGRQNDGDLGVVGSTGETTLVEPPKSRQRADAVEDEVTERLGAAELAEAVTTGVACDPPLYEELTPLSAEPTGVLPARRAPTSYRSSLLDAVSSEVTTLPNFDAKVREFRDRRRRNVRSQDETRVDPPTSKKRRASVARESRPDAPQNSQLLQAMVPVFVGLALAIAGFMWGLAQGRATDVVAVGSALAVSSTSSAVAGEDKAVGARVEQAIAGEAPALRALESLPRTQLTARELLALEAGQRTRKERQLWALSIDSPRKMNAQTQVVLTEQAADPRLAPAVLAAFAELEGSAGPDLLYLIATSETLPARTRQLAERALRAPDVRRKASPALRVLLDLRNAKTCEERVKVLPRAIEHGDERARESLSAMARLRSGCGPRGRDDCNACLKRSPDLAAAIRAVRARPAPPLRKLP